MKAKLIKRAALAAAILAGVGVAYGDTESALQVVYCKATITDNANEFVSVTLPPTEGYYDNNGNPLTYWNVGNVPAGGVADSWHGEGGPGRFTAHNEGSVGAYFYVTTSHGLYQKFYGNESSHETGPFTNVWQYSRNGDTYETVNRSIFASSFRMLEEPAISPNELRMNTSTIAYHLAFTTDTMAKVPTWHSLDHRRDGGVWRTEESGVCQQEVAGYMGYVDAGDYLTFDLKFWAPRYLGGGYYNYLFTFCVEASSFPLWDHGRAVE